jgi:hypothetical protein
VLTVWPFEEFSFSIPKEEPVSLFSVVSRVRNEQAQNQGLVFGGGHRDKNENWAHSASSRTGSVSFFRG